MGSPAMTVLALQYRGDAVDLDVEMSRPRQKVDQDPRRRIFSKTARMDRAAYRFIAAECFDPHRSLARYPSLIHWA
jgi:hypothetical protein